MKLYLADTHALYWYRIASPRLGSAAKNAFDEAAAGNALILIPSIVLAELYFLNQKHGYPLDFEQQYQLLLSAGQFELVPFNSADVLDFDKDRSVSEMHDRIIIGLARRRGAILLTRDEVIVSTALVRVVW